MSDASLPDLDGRRILLGVTGSIAAYKAALLVRLLKRAGAQVQVLMTEDAKRFITPLTLGTLSEREVLGEIFPENEDGSWTKHVTLGRWADLFVVAPATAQTLAKLAGGFSDSMLTATALSARCPLLVCPAMDLDMYRHPATQENLKTLQRYGYDVLPAAHGELASGLVGQGRLPEPEAIVDAVDERLSDSSDSGDRSRAEDTSDAYGESGAPEIGPDPQELSADDQELSADDSAPQDLQGLRILLTAGPTREHIDPVRLLTNPSTGMMGYALAEAATRRGAQVTLVSGPTHLDPPDGVDVVRVDSAEEMNDAVQMRRDTADVVIGAAAVADYTPTDVSDSKRKKEESDLVLHLRRTPDILKTVGENKRAGQLLIGFALETDDGPKNARRKLREKNLDWIVLNNPREDGAGFGTSTNRVTLFGRDGTEETLPLLSKREVAEALLDRIATTDPAPIPSPS